MATCGAAVCAPQRSQRWLSCALPLSYFELTSAHASASCSSARSVVHRLRQCSRSTAAASTSSSGTSIPGSSSQQPAVPAPAPAPLSPEYVAAYAAAKERHTLRSMYIPKRDLPTFVQLDHMARRRDKEVKEIVEVAKRVGMSEESVRENISRIESLLPDLSPNLDKMRASDWVKLLSDVNRVATMLIVLKSSFPRANISKIISLSPKMLLKDVNIVASDAAQVKLMLAAADEAAEAEGGAAAGSNGCDEIIEAVPYLLDPIQLSSSLSDLQRWFPSQDPVQLLRKNPKLLLNIGETDLEADPLYGWTST